MRETKDFENHLDDIIILFVYGVKSRETKKKIFSISKVMEHVVHLN